MKRILLLSIILFQGLITISFSQTADEIQIKKIYDAALSSSKSYDWLDYLSNEIGGRLSGSLNAEFAVDYTKSILESLNVDKVYLQPVMVPKWVRGAFEFAYMESDNIRTRVSICALGGSIATPFEGVKANVVEVTGFNQLEEIGKKAILGKIVFYNVPMSSSNINTFKSYSETVKYRYEGAEKAAAYGAVGVIIRSLSSRKDDFPHTGVMSYGKLDNANFIPAAAISTNAADLLSSLLSLNNSMQFFFKQSCKIYPDVKSHNVIGEIKGSELPNEVIVVGGHLDSWDIGDGAHDDGAGCVQSINVLNIFKKIGYKPKRTIRVVLFMNEENGLRGGKKYAEIAKKNAKERHIMALESDAGGFTPRGFSFTCDDAYFKKIESWKKLFEPYNLHKFTKGGSGADIIPLKSEKIVLVGLRPDSQRYFDYHHSENDTFEAVNKRELDLGSASMTSLVYLFDKYGLE